MSEKIGRFHAWVARSDYGYNAVMYTRNADPAVGDPADYGYSDNGVFYGWGEFAQTVEGVESGTAVGFNRPKANITLKIVNYDSQNGVFSLYSSITVNRFDTGVEELIGYAIDASQYADEPGFNVAGFYLGDATENAGIVNEDNEIMYYHHYNSSISKNYMTYGHDYSGPEIYDIQNERFLEDAKGKTITVTFGWVAM